MNMQMVKKLEEDGVKVKIEDGILYLNGWAVAEIVSKEEAEAYGLLDDRVDSTENELILI